MPTYEYLCEDCGYQFDVVQRITEDPLKECPKCKGSVKRLINCTNFLLKGDGWYRSGYSKNGSSNNSKKSETKKNDTKSCESCKSSCKADAA